MLNCDFEFLLGEWPNKVIKQGNLAFSSQKRVITGVNSMHVLRRSFPLFISSFQRFVRTFFK